MGRNSLKLLGQSTLGIKAIRVSEREDGKLPVSKAVEMRWTTSSPTICQYCLKKIPWKPSGPGALKGCI
jgi:hypothetical protein